MNSKKLNIASLLMGFLIFLGCSSAPELGTFGYDVAFLKSHTETLVLESQNGECQVALAPAYQGRIMTSASQGLKGKSYGWINYDLIASNQLEEHINVFGGEDRFWLGPEGGQYSIFFAPETDFTIDNWFTPKAIDTDPFIVKKKEKNSVHFSQQIRVKNYSDFVFDLDVERKVSIFDKSTIEDQLEIAIDSQISFVGFQSENKITNTGSQPWEIESGLLSIWILGMFNPSPETTVIIPYQGSLELNTEYFGSIGPERLTVSDHAVLFKGDGTYRSKIGLPPQNIKTPLFGSYDKKNRILTIVRFQFSGESTYVNSLWEQQEFPYQGDVVNSYNDGPLEDGVQLGPFYELESSSDSKELEPGESMEHWHSTYHFEGDFSSLNTLSKDLLGFDLSELN
jgi:hypothetical protein